MATVHYLSYATEPVAQPRAMIPAGSGDERVLRLPESVYRRRRMVVAAAAAAVLTAVLALGRPDSVPSAEINPWSSVGAVGVSATRLGACAPPAARVEAAVLSPQRVGADGAVSSAT